MKNHKRLHVVLAVAGILLCLFWFSANLVQGRTDSTSSISQEGYELDLEIEGPGVAALDEVVTYTIHFTVSSTPQGDIWGITYGTPKGFTVVSTSPMSTTQLGTGLLRWEADDLSGYSTITVTGRHGLSTFGRAVHYAAFYDTYNPNLLSKERETVVTGISTISLPLILRN